MERLWERVGWKRLAVTGLCLIAWRALEQVPVSGLNQLLVSLRLQAEDTSSLIHAIGSGGIVIRAYSIVAIGIGPYINALIIMSILRVMSARLRALDNSPEGKQSLGRWTRGLAAVLVLGQAYGWTVLMQSGNVLPSPLDWFPRLIVCIELATGTMLLVWLGDILDEHGLGFGNGAILIYALTPVAVESHRLAALFANAPSVEALYLPFGIWLAFSIGVVVATVAVVLAVRRIEPLDSASNEPSKPVELKILLSGVLRPPMFASAVLFFPVIVGNYYAQKYPDLTRWISDHATAYGSNAWTDAAYVAVNACLVLGFTYFVAAIDLVGETRRELIWPMTRLLFVAGTFLAITVVVLPVLEWNATLLTNHGIGMSGFDVVLVSVVILGVVAVVDQRGRRDADVVVLASRLP